MSKGELPAIVDVREHAGDLPAWLTEQRPMLQELLHACGAVLFRNAGVDSNVAFENAVRPLCEELFTKNGEHVADNETGTVQTPVFYPSERKILWHNENSFHYTLPSKLFFCCLEPSATGGETTLADSRLIFARLSKAARELFERREVLYLRTYVHGFGLSYQKTLGVSTRSEAERYCRENGIQFEWRGDVLRTAARRPAVIAHPRTGARCFIAQGLHWHQVALPPDVREGLLDLYGRDMMPRDFCWGDGEPIEDAIMDELRGLYEELEVARPWQRGEFVMVDNLLTAHARNPYTGERKLLVVLADAFTYGARGVSERRV